jgi:hypothetical protein
VLPPQREPVIQPAAIPVAQPIEPISFEQLEREIARLFIEIKSQRRSYYTNLLEVLREQKKTADDQHVATYRGWWVFALTGLQISMHCMTILSLAAPHMLFTAAQGCNNCTQNLLEKDVCDLSRYLNDQGACNVQSFSKDVSKIFSRFSQMVGVGKSWYDNTKAGDRTEVSNLVDRLKSLLDQKAQEMLTEIREEDEALQSYRQKTQQNEQFFSRMVRS